MDADRGVRGDVLGSEFWVFGTSNPELRTSDFGHRTLPRLFYGCLSPVGSASRFRYTRPSRMRKHSVGTPEFHWSARLPATSSIEWDNRSTPRRMLKKARLLTHPTLAATSPARPESAKTASSPRDAPCPKQGRSERRGEEVHTALRVGRSPLQWVLANGKAPTAFPTSEKLLLDVEPLSAARTPLADFFSILLEAVMNHAG